MGSFLLEIQKHPFCAISSISLFARNARCSVEPRGLNQQTEFVMKKSCNHRSMHPWLQSIKLSCILLNLENNLVDLQNYLQQRNVQLLKDAD